MRALLIAVVAVLAACDPGGSYHVPGGIPKGIYFVLGGPAHTGLTARASWFTATVHVFLGIQNQGTTPIEIRPDAAALSDSEGPLARNDSQPVLRCTNREGPVVTLATGDTCEIEMTFRVTVDKDRLKKLTLTHSGVTRDGVAAPISVIFVLD